MCFCDSNLEKNFAMGKRKKILNTLLVDKLHTMQSQLLLTFTRFLDELSFYFNRDFIRHWC